MERIKIFYLDPVEKIITRKKKFTRKTMIIYIGRDKLQVSISRTNCRNVLPVGDTYE